MSRHVFRYYLGVILLHFIREIMNSDSGRLEIPICQWILHYSLSPTSLMAVEIGRGQVEISGLTLT